MKLTERLFRAVAPIWEGYHSHPFVKGLGDGTLSMEQFRYYLVQDYLYLMDYSKVFALGVAKSPTLKDMETFYGFLTGTLGGEMDIHRGYMLQLGVTEEEINTATLALPNSSYTSYMLAEANAGGIAEILASILACSWSYAVIGQRLAENPKSLEHPFYGTWVTSYSSGDYAQMNAEIMDYMDRLGEGCSPAQLDHIQDIFLRCSLYEQGFWDMAWQMEKPPC